MLQQVERAAQIFKFNRFSQGIALGELAELAEPAEPADPADPDLPVIYEEEE